MVRLYIWTVLVLGSQTAVAVTSWSDRAAVEGLTNAVRTAMAEQTNDAAVALQLAVDNVAGHATPILATTIAALIATIGWLHSAAVVVHRGHLGYLRHGTGWAIGAWFVPFLNLVRVPSIAADVFRAARTSPPAGLVVGLWWLLWIGDGLVGRLAAGSLGTVHSASDFVSALSMTSLSDLLSVGSAAMTLTLALLVTSGLRHTRGLTASTAYEFERAPAGGFPDGHWGTPVETLGDTPPLADGRFGTPVPDSRFGAPAPAAPAVPSRFGTPVAGAALAGPPEPWLAAPPPTAPAQQTVAPAPGSAAPSIPAAPPAPPAAPSPTGPASPYPTTGVFYPQ